MKSARWVALAFCLCLVVWRVWFWPPAPLDWETPLRQRDLIGIQRALTKLENTEPQAPVIPLLKGARHLFTDHPEQALRVFAKLDPQGPLGQPLLLLTGEALYRTGDWNAAQLCLQNLIQRFPDDADGQRWLAILYYDWGALDQALAALNEVTRLDPADYRPFYMRGSIYHDFGRFEDSIKELQTAEKLTTSPTALQEIRLVLARSLLEHKQPQQALEVLGEQGNSAPGLTLKAQCSWDLGDAVQAKSQLASAERLGPLTPAAQRLQARIFMEGGEFQAAKSLLEKLISVDASNNETEYLLALVCQRLDDQPGYTRHLARSEEIKQIKNQLTELSRTAMQETNNAEVRDQLATLCEHLGSHQLAQVWRTAAAACRQPESPSGAK